MGLRTDSKVKLRQNLVVSPSVFEAEVRPTGYLLTNSFLTQHAIMTRALRMRPSKMLIFLTIVTATVQKLMRSPALPDDLHGRSRLPREMIGYISRRGISASTRIPRENVRRIVDELLMEHQLILGPRNGLANRGRLLERPEIIAGMEQLVVEIAHVADRLLQAGVIEIRTYEAEARAPDS